MSNETKLTEVTLVDESSKQLLTVVQSAGLEDASAQSLFASFEPLLKQAQEWQQKVALVNVTDVSQTREMKLAHETRMALREIRIKAEKVRKQLKEDSLRRGKAVDGAYNIVEFLIAPLEKRLLDQEQFAKNKELERKAALKQSRIEALSQFVSTPGTLDLSGFVLEDMTEASFATLLDSTKQRFEAQQEAARKAEAARIEAEAARVAEEARIRRENEELRQQAAEKEAALQKERAEVAARETEAKRQADEKLRLEREEAARIAAEAKRQADEKARIEKEESDRQKAALQKAAEEAARLAREAQKKLDEQAAAREAEIKRAAREARRAAAAPDVKKLQAFAAELHSLPIPAFKNPELAPAIQSAINQLAEYVKSLEGDL